MNPTVSGLKWPKCRNVTVVKVKMQEKHMKFPSFPGNTGRGHSGVTETNGLDILLYLSMP